MFKDSIPRFFIVAFLSVVIFVGVCFTRDEERQHLQLQDNQERKLAAVGGFSDTLAPNTVCTDLMRLSVILQDGDGDSLGDALPFDYTLKTFFNHSPSGTQAMIVYSKEKRYAAAVFRGTEFFSLEDWTTNLNIDLVRADIPSIPSDVELHEGFIDAVFATGLAELFEPELIGLINDSDLDLEHIYLTGHSLGGALAHILGSYLAGNNNDLNFRVITFGQPNVGNSDFKQWSEDLSNLSVFRFVNRNDVVPRILGFRYKPAGHLFHIERRKSKLYYNQDGEGRYAGVPVNWYFALSLKNHLSRFYTRFFEKKSQITKFWPRTFEVTPACSWWQFWC